MVLNWHRPKIAVILGCILLAISIGLFSIKLSYDWFGLFLTLAFIVLVSWLLLPKMANWRDGSIPLRILVLALILKLGFAMIRYFTSFVVYGGSADAYRYDRVGTTISGYLWNFNFEAVLPHLQWGTDFVEFFTGSTYAVFGDSILGGYLVFAFISFLGSYFFYRTFILSFPKGNHTLFRILIFFFPSFLFWPNGIGKDSLVFFGIGLFSYGCIRILKSNIRGLVPLILGLAGVLWIRPHIATLLALSFILAFLVPGGKEKRTSIATFIIIIILAAVISWLVLPNLTSYIGIEELSPESLIERLQLQQSRAEGGSSFQVGDVTNPLTYPWVLITLLFRPFPWESHNIMALIQSFEGICVLVLVLWRSKSLIAALGTSFTNVYSRFILVYAIGFIIAFTAVTNFGIIARERIMFLPLFFMLVCYLPFKVDQKQNLAMVNF